MPVVPWCFLRNAKLWALLPLHSLSHLAWQPPREVQGRAGCAALNAAASRALPHKAGGTGCGIQLRELKEL